MLGWASCCISYDTVFSFDPEPARQLQQFLPPVFFESQPLDDVFSILSFAITSLQPVDAGIQRYSAISCNTAVFMIDPEPTQQLHSNSCHRAFVHGTLVLYRLSIYPYFSSAVDAGIKASCHLL
jgi:hypothetical protein